MGINPALLSPYRVLGHNVVDDKVGPANRPRASKNNFFFFFYRPILVVFQWMLNSKRVTNGYEKINTCFRPRLRSTGKIFCPPRHQPSKT